MIQRPRRLRANKLIRELSAETSVSPEKLIYPYFICAGNQVKRAIDSMPGIDVFSPDEVLKDVEVCLNNGLNKFLLFGTGESKSADGSSAIQENSLIASTINQLRSNFGSDIFIVSDVCLCSYTSHGHCGIIAKDDVENDATTEVLAKMALQHAKAGVDMVAPSDMMDGRVAAIRTILDKKGYFNTSIMSYAVKYASAYYGPFREAADSSPEKGDRKSYQMDVRNSREAIKEALKDEGEGADILMVKPALAYLDVIQKLRNETNLPLAGYNVSGEYSMVKAAAAKNYIDERGVVVENFTAMTRAGAEIIISYHAKEAMINKWIS